MEILQLDVLLKLLIAHLLADFIFQTNKIVKEKKKGLSSRLFYLHIFLVGLLTYVLYAQWTNWWAPLLIMVMHAAIDLLKIKINLKNSRGFITDQLLHIISILILWILVTSNTVLGVWGSLIIIELSNNALIIILAYLIISIPASVLIGQMTRKWQKEVSKEDDESLTDAGKWIGIIERSLILTFIIIGQWAPIGFLLAGKSIFRFGDLNRSGERKKTEYILIGTLLSFTFSIFIGILTYHIVTKV